MIKQTKRCPHYGDYQDYLPRCKRCKEHLPQRFKNCQNVMLRKLALAGTKEDKGDKALDAACEKALKDLGPFHYCPRSVVKQTACGQQSDGRGFLAFSMDPSSSVTCPECLASEIYKRDAEIYKQDPYRLEKNIPDDDDGD